ncbi:MAG: tetratricopeptide repeat protein [Rhodospirillales bacterium]|nr:tetratricopeptide repeat protein [Rhodospirillales bacterium]
MTTKPPAKGVLDHLIPSIRTALPLRTRAERLAVFRAAGQHLNAGRFAEAEALVRGVLAGDPRNTEALDLLGIIVWKAGRPDHGLQLFDRAIIGNSRVSSYHLHRGAVLGARGRFEDAVVSLRRAAVLDSQSTDAHYNLGLALNRLQDRDGAVAAYGRAIRCDPRHAQAQNNLGALLMEQGDHIEAEACFRRVLAIDFAMVSGHTNLATALLEQGRLDEARASGEASLGLRETALGHYVLGRIADRQKLGDAARQHYERAIALDPRLVAARLNLGNTLRGLGLHIEALALSRDAARAHPTDSGILNNFGLALLDAAKLNEDWSKSESMLEEARTIFERALTLDPTAADVRYNYATVLDELGRDEAAIAAIDTLIAQRPDWENAHFLRGKLQLRSGRWDEGADAFQWYWRSPIREKALRPFASPWWEGQALAPGERLLVWADQGVGDQIVYSSLLPTLVATGTSAVLECDPRLVDIFRRSLPTLEVVAKVTPPDAATVAPNLVQQSPLSGLLKPLGPWPSGLPKIRRHLTPEPQRAQECKARLDAALPAGRRIGLSWQSKRLDRSLEGPKKSVELLQWAPILKTPGLAFVNLQYGDTDTAITTVQEQLGVPIYTDPTIDRFDDIDGMLALIDTLDLVITVSNVTAHFAGAIGKDCWVMIRKAPFWYWGREGERSPIYDSVRLFRQEKSGDWAPVIDRIAEELGRAGPNQG